MALTAVKEDTWQTRLQCFATARWRRPSEPTLGHILRDCGSSVWVVSADRTGRWGWCYCVWWRRTRKEQKPRRPAGAHPLVTRRFASWKPCGSVEWQRPAKTVVARADRRNCFFLHWKQSRRSAPSRARGRDARAPRRRPRGCPVLPEAAAPEGLRESSRGTCEQRQ